MDNTASKIEKRDLINIILGSVEGTDRHGNPQAAISMSVLLKSEDMEPQEVEHADIESAAVLFARQGEYIYLYLDYGDATDELKKTYETLQKFGEKSEELAESADYEPSFVTAIMPTNLMPANVLCYDPLYWTVLPGKTGHRTMIRLVFESENIAFNVHDIDDRLIDKEAQNELESEIKQISDEIKVMKKEIDQLESDNAYQMADDFDDINFFSRDKETGQNHVYGTPRKK